MKARQAAKIARRGQQPLDEGHLSRMRRGEAKRGREKRLRATEGQARRGAGEEKT
jgi:hypothetical protein